MIGFEKVPPGWDMLVRDFLEERPSISAFSIRTHPKGAAWAPKGFPILKTPFIRITPQLPWLIGEAVAFDELGPQSSCFIRSMTAPSKTLHPK